jgi:uncharacterized protein YqeY
MALSLAGRLDAEIKAAMLARDADRLGALRMLKSAAGYVAIEKKTDALSDADFISLVQREVKKRREAAEQFEKGGRPELAAKELAEIRTLEIFLPQPLTEAELEALIREVIAETGASSKMEMGTVIKAAQARVAGRADGRAISTLVGRLLP